MSSTTSPPLLFPSTSTSASTASTAPLPTSTPNPSSSTSTFPLSSSQPPSQPQTQTQTLALQAFTTALHTTGHSLTSDLRARAADIHSNSSAIAKQELGVSNAAANLGKESARYAKLADESGGKLKELGDIQNWAEVLERELLVLERAVEGGMGGKGGDGG